MPKHYQTSGRTLSGFQHWWDIITTNPHERPLWVLVQKCLFSLSGRHEGSLRARNRDSPMMSSGEENPSSFPLVVGAEKVREEGWELFWFTTLWLSAIIQFPGRSMQNGPLTTPEGRRGQLYFCNSRQRLIKKKKSTLVSSGHITRDWLCQLQAGSSMTEYRILWFLSMLEVDRTEIPVESQRSWVLFIFDWRET